MDKDPSEKAPADQTQLEAFLSPPSDNTCGWKGLILCLVQLEALPHASSEAPRHPEFPTVSSFSPVSQMAL